MKKVLYSILAVLLFCAAAFAAQKRDVSGVVAYSKGQFMVLEEGSKKWAQVRPGQFIHEGDTVRTGASSRGGVLFNNGVETKLNSNTTYKVEKKDISEKAEGLGKIKMIFGKVWTRILKPKTKFEIKTPVAVASVRGTEYETSVEKSGRTEIKVFAGEVELANEFGSVKIKKDSKSSVEPGQAPQAPVPLKKGEETEWKEEAKSMGSVKIEAKSTSFTVKEEVECEVTVLDPSDKKDKDYSKELKITSDNSQIVFSAYDKNSWAASYSAVPSNGELKFKIKAYAALSAGISVSGEDLGASMISVEAKLPARKDLKLKIRDAEGKEKELLFKFKPK
ncbi:MAG: FecR domain-containing protein [Endomicrobiales bacterium]|nr:FecR domain-containing protein [Endomicrobiales bacterium]